MFLLSLKHHHLFWPFQHKADLIKKQWRLQASIHICFGAGNKTHGSLAGFAESFLAGASHSVIRWAVLCVHEVVTFFFSDKEFVQMYLFLQSYCFFGFFFYQQTRYLLMHTQRRSCYTNDLNTRPWPSKLEAAMY